MSKLHIEQPHALDGEAVRKVLDSLFVRLSEKFGIESKWTSETEAQVGRTGLTGTVRVTPKLVTADLDLSFALNPMKGKIEARIREELQRLLVPSPSADVATRSLSKEQVAELAAVGQSAHRTSLRLSLIDDDPEEQREHLIGIVVAPAALPRIVACHQPGKEGPVSLCEIEQTVLRPVPCTGAFVLTLDTEKLAALHETGRVRHGFAWVRLIPKPEDVGPIDDDPVQTAAQAPPASNPPVSENDPAPPAAEPSEEDRIAQATEAYRVHRVLASQPDADIGQLASASAAWTTARDSFPEGSPGAARLAQATAQVDGEILAEKRRPQMYPNQLPGAIPVLDAKAG